MIVSSLCVAAALSLPGQAWAQSPPLRESGHAVLSAERLFGFSISSNTETTGPVDTTTTTNTVSFLGNPAGILNGYTWPRLGLDFFVSHALSVGVAATYFHTTTGVGDNDISINGFLLAPRIGYAAMMGPRFGIWPRAGLTFGYRETNVASSATTYALTLEAPFTILIAHSAAAVTFGPTVDIGIGGSSTDKATRINTDTRTTDLGFQAGLLLYF